MTPAVPRERRHPVAEPDAVSLQPLRQTQGSGADFGVVGFVDGAFDRARYDRPPRVVRCGMIDNAMAEQRPILHQSKHGVSLVLVLSRCSAPQMTIRKSCRPG